MFVDFLLNTALLEDAENELTDIMRPLLHRQYIRLITLDNELEWYDSEQKKYVRQDPVCKRLLAILGFGPLNAASFRVVRVPEPVLSRFTADKAPLLIKFADECHISMSDRG